MHPIVFLCCSFSLLIAAAAAAAQDLPEGFLACAAIDADDERLACFDREVTRQLLARRESRVPAESTAAAADGAEASVDTAESTAVVATAPVTEPAPEVAAPTSTADAAHDAVPEESAPVESAPAESARDVMAASPAPDPAATGAPAGQIASASAATVVATPDSAPTVAATPEAPAVGSDDDFGMTEKLAEQRAATIPDARQDEAQEPEQITAIVTDIKRQPHGEHVVALDNGQVWAEEHASRYFPVEIGDTVVIKKRWLKGYRLVAESGKGFAVERLR